MDQSERRVVFSWLHAPSFPGLQRHPVLACLAWPRLVSGVSSKGPHMLVSCSPKSSLARLGLDSASLFMGTGSGSGGEGIKK